ncbi:hypothetical protein SO802_011450 [Lithocarpus litseifolius]|uniref:Uncharacterized protein n=1 Tax=Lithocarpus litseifolius TaxID=425828 RepID=A0AAW2D1D2_9ROSI
MAIALFVDSQFRFKEGSVFKSGKFDVIKGRGECNLHPRVWSPSADNRITVSCDVAIKSHPTDMAATAFVARDKRCISLFAGVCKLSLTQWIWLPLRLSQGISVVFPYLLECARDISSREKFLNWKESA